MTPQEVFVNNRSIKLGRLIGRGGEGAVYALEGDTTHAIKLYTVRGASTREEKVEAMVRAGLSSKTPLIAFPVSSARAPGGAFQGFVMRLVADHKPLHNLYSPGSRKIHFPKADYRFLVRTAANLARAVAVAHQANCVIGDINHSGILVSDKATVALIDADSFQFSGNGRQYLCVVGVPEYTPPELQGNSLAGVVRTANHDAFGLAVVVFQLLFMGRHPYVGTVRRGDIPPLHENIRNHRYVYSDIRNVGMDQPPGTPDILDFAPAISELFESAFSASNSTIRPSALDWVKRLDALEASLEKCDQNALHYIPKEASDCAWCDMERQLNVVLFQPYLQAPEFSTDGFDPGASGFNLEQVWAAIVAIRVPHLHSFQPKLPSPKLEPSVAARQAAGSERRVKPGAFIIVAATVIAFFALPQAFLLWLIVLIIGIGNLWEDSSSDRRAFLRTYAQAESLWDKELQSWQQRIGAESLIRAEADLHAAKDEYQGLRQEEAKLRAAYTQERRSRQLTTFLDTFSVQGAHIKGIGPAKKALLTSFGVDTAADVERGKLLSIPGFGEATAQILLSWRTRTANRFSYSEAPNEADRQEFARIRNQIEAKAVPLRRKLFGGARQLKEGLRQVEINVAKDAASVVEAFLRLEQARCDVQFLGLSTAQAQGTRTTSARAPIPSSSTSSTQPNQPSPIQYPPRQSGAHTCPRCGSQMVKRLAKRGRNAGGYFWGCSRYPNCKGTKNI